MEIFKCSGQGGMRRSKRTNSLVLISNRIENLYKDRWDEEQGILYYTGMGQKGDQVLKGNQNKTLYELNENQVKAYLFEVYEKKEYVFRGEVSLHASPYKEEQIDAEGDARTVWVFPIKLLAERHVSQTLIDSQREKEEKRLHKKSRDEIYNKAKLVKGKPSKRQTMAIHYERNAAVAEYVKRKANGICQLCKQPAPFIKKDGEPYLEAHHIVWLSRGGEDTIENSVALCPNCHKKMHVIDDINDIDLLKAKVLKIND